MYKFEIDELPDGYILTVKYENDEYLEEEYTHRFDKIEKVFDEIKGKLN